MSFYSGILFVNFITMILKYRKPIMYLIAFHSFIVGVMLIFMPPEWFKFFGFETGETFFSVQGGVFHWVMIISYLFSSSSNILKARHFLLFSAMAKSIAVVFLFSFAIIVKWNLLIVLSALGDLAMASIIFLIFVKLKKNL